MKIMRVKQQDGTLVDIPIGVDTASSAVSTHNTNTSAHADIRAAIDSKANKSEGTFYITGLGTTNSTDKISTWTGTSDRITEYYDGLAIRYKIGVAGQSTTTLNINGLGAKTVYRFSTTKLTTQFPVGSVINLIYHTDLNDGCWMCNDYDANTNTYQRVYETSTNKEYAITTRYNTTDGETYYAEYGRYTNGVTLNPSTNTITATAFKGKLTGNADTATKAIQDASGNVITSTYETKADATTKLNNVNTQISQLSSEIVDLPNNELLVQNVAQKVPYVKVAEPPTFVDSVDEMTDTSKMYVLKSDVMFYSYKAHTITIPGGTFPNFTNKIPTSIDANGAIYNGTGYKNNTRLSSSGSVKENEEGHTAFGFIPAKGGDTIRFKSVSKNGADVIWYDTRASANYICAYDANFNFLYAGNSQGVYQTSSFVDSMSLDGSVSVIKLKNVANIAYIRMSVYNGYSLNDIIGESAIITVNEEITYTTREEGTTTTYSWESTGISYNQPADYEHRVIAMENELEVLLNGTF